MGNILDDLTGGMSPEMVASAMRAAEAVAERRKKFLAELKAEKGPHHALVANQLMRTYSIISMLLLIRLKVEEGIKDHARLPTAQQLEVRLDATFVLMLQGCQEMAATLGLSEEDFRTLDKAAQAAAHSIVEQNLKLERDGS